MVTDNKEKLIHNFIEMYFPDTSKTFKKKTTFITRNTITYYINGERFGTTRSDSGHKKLSVDKKLYDTLRVVFGTSPIKTRKIVESWFLKNKSLWFK